LIQIKPLTGLAAAAVSVRYRAETNGHPAMPVRRD